MTKDKNVQNLEDALSSLTDTQATLFADTSKNMPKGAYWTVESANDMESKGYNEHSDEILQLASVTPLDNDKFLIVYNNPNDFFSLLEQVYADKADLVTKAEDNINAAINKNKSTFYTEFPKTLERAYKKAQKAGGQYQFQVAVYCLNESNKTKITYNGSEKTIPAYMATFDELKEIILEFSSKTGAQIVALTEDGETAQADENGFDFAFNTTNKLPTSGVWADFIIYA